MPLTPPMRSSTNINNQAKEGKIIHGDSLQELKTIETDSIDFVCTDPPYGYSFMGKDWDKAVPSVDIWQECLRVLKPGAFMCVMSAPRSDVQFAMTGRLIEAGFRLDFTPIYWTYASGFPKAGNIGKLVDKRNGRDQGTYKPFADYLKTCRIAKGYSMKHMDDKLGTNTAYSWWEGRSSGIQLPTKELYEKLKIILDLDNSFDGLIKREEAERIAIGKKQHSSPDFTDDQYTSQSSMMQTHTKVNRTRLDITVPSTDQAKSLDGSYAGFQPKPAVEVIIIAMKPLDEKTYLDQALKNGKGISWLDDCRIPTTETATADRYKSDIKNSQNKIYAKKGDLSAKEIIPQGRFPANLLVSDEILDDGIERSPSFRTGDRASNNDGILPWNKGRESGRNVTGAGYDDSGGFSRYFNLDKWAQTLPFLIVPKASKSEKNKGLDQLKDREGGIKNDSGRDYSEQDPMRKIMTKNNHPTVKPLKLMSYLITLFTREGDTVLDPFVGSGTTCLAAKKLRRKYVGIEREAEYIEIANARLAADNQEVLL